MKYIAKKSLTIIIAFALAFTGIPVLAGGFSADAAASVGQVKKVSARWSHNYVNLTWKKVSTKGLGGYTIYRGGKAKKSVNAKTLAYKDTSVKALTQYTYYVKAYKNVKQKRYYNTKTRKWQLKKPAKNYWKACKSGKYKGKKTITVTVKKYGKASPAIKLKTTAAPSKKVYNKNVSKPSGSGTDNQTGSETPAVERENPRISVKFKFSHNKVTLSWEAHKEATGFKVLRDGSEIATLGADISSYTDEGLSPETAYTYTVCALEEDKSVVEVSKEITTPSGPQTDIQ